MLVLASAIALQTQQQPLPIKDAQVIPLRDTPPAFIFQTNEDATVPAENSLHYFLALRQAGVAAEMHVFEKGAHGVVLANDKSTSPCSGRRPASGSS
jgi:acetyl esterase/lipase